MLYHLQTTHTLKWCSSTANQPDMLYCLQITQPFHMVFKHCQPTGHVTAPLNYSTLSYGVQALTTNRTCTAFRLLNPFIWCSNTANQQDMLHHLQNTHTLKWCSSTDNHACCSDLKLLLNAI